MTKEIWLNLPVKNVAKSKEFFTKIGFRFDGGMGDSDFSSAMKVGDKNFVVMLFEENTLQSFTQHPLGDTSLTSQFLISFDAENPEEVDQLAIKVKEAGGNIFAEVGWSQGWMYGFAFEDLDHHRWNVLYMDMSKMPHA